MKKQITQTTSKKLLSDYMKPSSWKRIKVNDRTKNRTGQPTFKSMERLLTKTINNA